jgi:hypothetical protein
MTDKIPEALAVLDREPTMQMLHAGLAHSYCPPISAERLSRIYVAMRSLEPIPKFDAWAKEQGYDLSVSCIGLGYGMDDTSAARHGWAAAIKALAVVEELK